MHILYLADIRFPLERANGLQTFETCRALAAAGHEVRLLVRPDTFRPARDPWAFYGATRDARMRITQVPSLPGPLRRPNYLAAAVAYTLAGNPDVVLTRDLTLADTLLMAPRRFRPTVVYESHGYAPVVSVELPRMIAGVVAPSARKLRRLTRREFRVWRHAAGYVTLTRVHQQELEDRFGRRTNAAVVPDGTRLAATRTFNPPPADAPQTVVYSGHLYPWKGVDVLIEALSLAPEVKVRIVGGQPGEQDRARLETLARDRGVSERVTFTGWLPPSQVAAELQQAHVLVLPNARTHVSERYTSPLKLFEYLAAGRPIVASNLAALREILRDDVNAVLVEPGSAGALAAALHRVTTDADTAARLARQAFADAAQYGWDARAERLGAVLDAARGAAA